MYLFVFVCGNPFVLAEAMTPKPFEGSLGGSFHCSTMV